MDINITPFLPHHPVWQPLVAIGMLGILAFTARFLVQFILLHGLARLLSNRQRGLICTLLDHKFLRRLAQIIPSLIVQLCIHYVPGLPLSLARIIQSVALALTVFHIARALTALLDALMLHHGTAEGESSLKTRSIKSWVQFAQLLIGLASVVIMIAALLNKSPVIVLSGLGAMSAVLMLVFKDTILSFTAGVQLSGSDMLRVGDWIEMPQVGADGDVIDIALNTVRVQNGDKTITTIPTWRLVSESFKNWRGMRESGGRRIKRQLVIDAGSIRFLDDEEVAELEKIVLLSEHLHEKGQAIRIARSIAENTLGSERARMTANQRRLTNLGVFRTYVQTYLQAHADIRQDMSLVVRTLEPTASGVPMELYCFAATTNWSDYEAIQSNIFDHLLAILPEFGLRPFQNPSGSDLQALLHHARGGDAS